MFRLHANYVNFPILRNYFIRRVAPADFSTGALARYRCKQSHLFQVREANAVQSDAFRDEIKPGF